MFRPIAYLLIFATISLSSLAQEITTVKKKRMQNFYLAPSVGTEILSVKKYTDENNGSIIVYKGVPSLRLGMDVDYKKSEKLIIHTGLFYSAKNFNRIETMKENNSDLYDQKFKNRYIETLIGGAYNFVSSRLDVGAYTNLNFSYILSAHETRWTETGNKFINNNKPNYTKILSVLEPGIKFNYNINYRLSFGLKTGYRLYLNSISVDKKFSNNGVLIQSGLFYKF